jgi:hypothetical protein
MLTWNSHDVLEAMRNIGGILAEWNLLRGDQMPYANMQVPVPTRVTFLRSIRTIRDAADVLGFRATVHIVDSEYDEILGYCEEELPQNSPRIEALSQYAYGIFKVFVAEAKTTTFLAIDSQEVAFFAPESPLFGDEVAEAFPSAAIEIADAGQCRALELWTASVMHLMRALENVIQVLADYVGADVGPNWNQALNQIEAKLRERNKTNFGESEEQWASEAAAHLRAIKNAWRNHVQHGRSRYDAREAKAIWDNVQALMRTLAKRLME